MKLKIADETADKIRKKNSYSGLVLKEYASETSESILARISYKVIRKTGCLKFPQKVSLCKSRER